MRRPKVPTWSESMSILFTLLAQSDTYEGSLEGNDHRESKDLLPPDEDAFPACLP